MLSWEEYNTDEAITPSAPVVPPEVIAEHAAEAPEPVAINYNQGVAADAEAAAMMADNVNRAKGSIDPNRYRTRPRRAGDGRSTSQR